ncbi:hypothetical protein [Actinomadura sp. 6N118]|uniref:hypothetical protein n=1 Tax=Actinomadura sp. 6N118 TaxID=3375151 RepID=UPI0037A89D97
MLRSRSIVDGLTFWAIAGHTDKRHQGPSERGAATLKSWRILRKCLSSRSRASSSNSFL